MRTSLLRSYFHFTRKEKRGVIVLVVLILVVFVSPYFFKSATMAGNRQAFEQFKNEIAQLKVGPPESAAHGDERSPPPAQELGATVVHRTASVADFGHAALFYFDPNTANPAQWKTLGVQDRTVQTIGRYLARGGKFRAPADLQKIYGLPAMVYQRLLPYVRIPAAVPVVFSSGHAAPVYEKPVFHKKEATVIADINTADSNAFMSLPGIGSKLAARILNFRAKLGGFYSVDQVGETFGLPDSVFRNIRPMLHLADASPQQLSINTADANTLKQHPYIRWIIAKEMVSYRAQHGGFHTLDELLQLASMTPELLKKMSPYLSLVAK